MLMTQKQNNQLRWLACILVATTMLANGSAFGAAISISNPSFETPVLPCTPGPDCSAFFTDISGSWLGGGFAKEFRPTFGTPADIFYTPLPDGLQVASVGGGHAVVFSGGFGEMFQDLSATVAANTTYTLTFYVGRRTEVALFSPDYSVALQAVTGPNLPISAGVDLAVDSGASPAIGEFVQRTIVYN